MVYYALLYCYVLTISLIEVLTTKKSRLFFTAIFVVAVFLLANRGGFGVDTKNYLLFFGDLGKKIAYSYDLDFGFFYLSYFIKQISKSEIFYFFCLAFVSIGFKMKAIHRLSPLPTISIFVLLGAYFLPLETNQVRQALALGAGLYSIIFVKKGKKTGFILTIALAASFHISAIILLPVWWLYKRKIPTNILYLILAASFVFVFISVEELFRFLARNTYIFGGFIFAKLSNYVSKIEQVGFSPIQLWYLFASTVFIHYRVRNKGQLYNFLLNIFIIGVAMNFFLNSFSYLLRITYYFLAVEGILLAIILYNSRKIVSRIVLFLLFVIMISFKNYRYYISNIEFYQ